MRCPGQSGPTTGPRREPGADMRTRTTIAGSAVALVGALGITAGPGLPGAGADRPGPAAPLVGPRGTPAGRGLPGAAAARPVPAAAPVAAPAPASIVPAAVSTG